MHDVTKMCVTIIVNYTHGWLWVGANMVVHDGGAEYFIEYYHDQSFIACYFISFPFIHFGKLVELQLSYVNLQFYHQNLSLVSFVSTISQKGC